MHEALAEDAAGARPHVPPPAKLPEPLVENATVPDGTVAGAASVSVTLAVQVTAWPARTAEPQSSVVLVDLSAGGLLPNTQAAPLFRLVGEPLLASAGLLTIDPKDGTSGTLMGFPFQTSNNVPTNQTYGTANSATTIVFDKWSEAYVGRWDDMAIDVPSEASYTPDGGTT